jgi:putative transposon-encoded protein
MILMSKTTIQITTKTKEKLINLKKHPNHSYDEVINELIENKDQKENKIVKICNSDKYMVKEVRPYGNSGRVLVPYSWLGKEVVVVLKEDLESQP